MFGSFSESITSLIYDLSLEKITNKLLDSLDQRQLSDKLNEQIKRYEKDILINLDEDVSFDFVRVLKYIIMMFNDMKINRHGAQLIFTSHDLSTMKILVFRRDEIWFADKGNKEISKLYSGVEFNNDKGESVRKDAKFDKQYLEGKYGADPYLRKIIDWGKVNA